MDGGWSIYLEVVWWCISVPAPMSQHSQPYKYQVDDARKMNGSVSR